MSAQTTTLSPALLSTEIPTPRPSSLQAAMADGLYPEWLREELRKETELPGQLQARIAEQLEAMKLQSPEQRMEEYNWIVRYYSRSNKGFEDTSLRLFEHLGCPESTISEGSYDSMEVARNLLEGIRLYDHDNIVPVLSQIRDYLLQNFKHTNILFLGRDFCSTYLSIVEEQCLPREQLFLTNVSRYVRDVALGGKFEELRLVLERIGLTKDVLLDKGFLIADSCMQGKIPAVILKSLALPMTEEERYQFLTHSYIRYLKSSRHSGRTLAEKAYELGKNKKLSDQHLEELLGEKIEMIKEFPVTYPKGVEEFIPRRHKTFEWRPKVSLIAMGIEVDEFGPRLLVSEPKSPSERILCDLGLYADMELCKLAQTSRSDISTCTSERESTRDLHNVGAFEPKKMALEVALLPSKSLRHGQHIVSKGSYQKPTPKDPNWFLKEIDQALSGGLEGLRAWQNHVDPHVGSVAVMRTKDVEYPYELVINGKVIFRFRAMVGEGNNVKVYLSDQNSIVKVIKEPKHVRKNLLLAWAEPHVRNVGIRTAKVLQVNPTGLYLEQEAMPGESLESLYGEKPSIPNEICDQVISDFRAGKKLIAEKGLWLDLKSANYHLKEGGKIVNVDYAPRLNATYYRYFQADPEETELASGRRELKEDEFLEKFFRHDIQKRCKMQAEEAKKLAKKEKK